MTRALAVAIGALALSVAASSLAQRTAAPTQPRECSVRHHAFVQGGVAEGRMHVINDGNPCSFTFKFGQNFEPSEWKVEEAPKHGHLEAGGSTVKYLPESGYAGPDAFTVAVFGFNPMGPAGFRARNGRFHFKVDVRAAP